MNASPPGAAAASGLRPWLDVTGVSVALAGAPVLAQACLSLAQGELGCLLGPSGCGKTTLLRAIAGLQDVDAGTIAIAGRPLSAPGMTVAPEHRGVGLVFQDLALFPHLDVAANIGFGLHRLDRATRGQRVAGLLARLQLEALADRYPHELSGGQQQRVAIARALAPEPALLLLDEPFSSLDASLRQQLRGELRTLLRQLGHTALLVTHDQEEAMAFADRVAVMRAGRIEQADTPWQLYHRPVSRYVAGFVGEGVLLPLRRDGDGGGWTCALGPLAAADTRDLDGDGAVVLVRPDDLLPQPQSRLRAQVEAVEFRGAEELLSLVLADGSRVVALWPSHARAHAGAEVGLHWQPPHVVTFNA